MAFKTDMLSLEEEMTNVEIDSLLDERDNAKQNYSTLDNMVIDAKAKIRYPEISQYSSAIDYEDQSDLQFKKNMNKKFEKDLLEIENYANDDSLYCGHLKYGIHDVYLMDHGSHQSKHFKRSDGSEFFLLNVNDKLYQRTVNMWRFPSDYDEVTLSRNIILKSRTVQDVDVVFESDNSAFSDITDGYLRKALLRNKGVSNAQGIIQTIQKKQDIIRTLNKDISFIVQGCAGSGKTMVLLHRLRYLLYNNELNNDYALLIPSTDFRTFISDLSQKFKINKSNIFSYPEYYASLQEKTITEEIKDELVFDEQYLQTVYSEEFIQNCYRSFFKNIIEQTGEFIVYCDESLSNKFSEEYETIFKKLDNLDDYVLDELNHILKDVLSYLGINSLESIEDARVVLQLLQEDYKNRLANIESDDKVSRQRLLEILNQAENNPNLMNLRDQIDKAKKAYENASRFTKLSHKRKLEQLELNYEKQKDEFIESAIGKYNNQKQDELINVKNHFTTIIIIRLQEVIDKMANLIKNRDNQKAFFESVIDEYEEMFPLAYERSIELLNEFIEQSSFISDYEKKSVESLNQCGDSIRDIINRGAKVASNFIVDNIFRREDLTKITKLYLRRTGPQLTTYLYQVLFGIVKNAIFKNNDIKICKVYKHYWYLQLYCKYLVGFAAKKCRYIFIDEAQDLNIAEIRLIRKINTVCIREKTYCPVFNLFGDVNQTITKHGITNWNELNYDMFILDENFRNTNQIIDYCNTNLPFVMKKIGVDMDDVLIYSDIEEAICYNNKIKDNPMIIVKDEFVKHDLNLLFDKMQWEYEYSIITVKEAKGLEFKEVFVVDCEMNNNEKYIAYTRALANLFIIKNIPINKEHINLIINGDENEDTIEINEVSVDNNKSKSIVDPLDLLPKNYKNKSIKVTCVGKIEGICYLIPYSGKLKKIDGLTLEQNSISLVNKIGKKIFLPISINIENRMIFIQQDIYKSFEKALTSENILEIA